MSNSEKTGPLSAILEAIRAKRERKTGTGKDIAELEASLLADIDAFDFESAERRARREYLANSGAGMTDRALVFPEIAPAQPTVKTINTPHQEVMPDTPPSKAEAPRKSAAVCWTNCASVPRYVSVKFIAPWQNERRSTKPLISR